LDFWSWRGIELAAREFPAHPGGQTRRPAVLFVHGWQGAQDANDVLLATALSQEGFSCMCFDLGGHGRSGGDADRFCLADFFSQALSAYDRLSQSALTGDGGIVVCGASLGSYLAVLLSAVRPLAALGLRVPANYPDEIFDAPALAQYVAGAALRPWRAQACSVNTNRALRALQAFEGPVQIIAAGRDETIPYQTLRNYLDAAQPSRLEFQLLPEATHVLYESAAMRAASFRLVRDWLLATWP
jgi:uncharacterized protein